MRVNRFQECENILKATRDGKISELKGILEPKSEDERRALVSYFMNGSTPLLIACHSGHLDVATYLLDKCHADVEQAGYVPNILYSSGKPLYYAVAAGHLSIVKTLIKHKASVNETTFLTNTLVEACKKGHFDIAKYLIEHGADIELKCIGTGDRSCLIVSCEYDHYEITKYLLECGADVNKKTEYGDTALHTCVRSGSLEIIKMLLQHGCRMCINQEGFTPLLLAVDYCHASIVEYFIEECNYTKQEKVDALELLGAWLADDQQIIDARTYWRQAMHLRFEDDTHILEKHINESLISYYYDTTEVCTLDQLDQLIDAEMEIQALLVKERIRPSQFDLIFYLLRRGRTFADNGDFKRCIELCISILDAETDMKIDKVLDYIDIDSLMRYSIVPLTKLFYKMMPTVGNFDKAVPAVSFWDILHVFESTTKPIEKALSLSQNGVDLNFNEWWDLINIAMHLLNLMARLQPYLKSNEERSMKQAAYKLVHLNPKGRKGFTLLHIASSKCTSIFGVFKSIITYDEVDGQDEVFHDFTLPRSPFPSVKVVDLLLEVGACPNAKDSNTNTPLHVAAMNRPCATDVFHALLKQGAHIDLYNNENQTPLQLLDDASLLEMYPLQHLNLQCLCAQAIDKHTISYKGSVPKELYEFIELHGSR